MNNWRKKVCFAEIEKDKVCKKTEKNFGYSFLSRACEDERGLIKPWIAKTNSDLNKSWQEQSDHPKSGSCLDNKPQSHKRNTQERTDEYRHLWQSLSLPSKHSNEKRLNYFVESKPPVIGIYDDSKDFLDLPWQNIEVVNIKNILNMKSKLKFYRLNVTEEQINTSYYNNGMLNISNDVYQSILVCHSKYAKYLLLQESIGSGLQCFSQLVGVANIQKVVENSSERIENTLYVTFLCLSRSGIDLSKCNANNQLSVKEVLVVYIQTISDKAAEPFLPKAFPWNGSLSKAYILEEKIYVQKTEEEQTEYTSSKAGNKQTIYIDDNLDEASDQDNESIQFIDAVQETKKEDKESTLNTNQPVYQRTTYVSGSLDKKSCRDSELMQLVDAVQDQAFANLELKSESECSSQSSGNLKKDGQIENPLNNVVHMLDNAVFEHHKEEQESEENVTAENKFTQLQPKTEVHNFDQIDENEEKIKFIECETRSNDRKCQLKSTDKYKFGGSSSNANSGSNSNKLPPIQNLLKEDKSLNTDHWQIIEHKNLEEISDWDKSKFVICDLSLPNIYRSFSSDGVLKLDSFLISQLGDSMKLSVYLVIRKSHSSVTAKHKPVIGIAKLLSKTLHDVQVCYLCLSKAQYVQSPWCDEEEYTNGQVFQFKEDVRILLDEYKMSLKYKKAKPVFNNIYPWSEKLTVFNTMKQTAEVNCSGANVFRVKDMLRSKRTTIQEKKVIVHEQEPKVDNEAIKKSLDQVNKKSPNKVNVVPHQSTYASRSRGNCKSEGNTPKSETNDQVMCTCKSKRVHNIPFRGFYVSGTKTLNPKLWQEIERNNLEYINTTAIEKEFYICDTSVKAIRQSFRTALLPITQRNMENLATAGRSRKYLLLRTVLQEKENLAIIGIASVVLSAGIIRNSQVSGEFLAQVLFLSLSIPMFKQGRLLFGCAAYDGMEVYSHVWNNVLQKYMLGLKERTVRPLLPDMFPWNSRKSCFSCKSKTTSSSSSVPSIPDSPRSTSTIDDGIFTDGKSEQKDLFDDNLPDDNLLAYLNTESTSSITFRDIQNEISLNCIKAGSTYYELYTPLPFKPQVTNASSKETVENKIRRYHTEFSHQMMSNNVKRIHKKPSGVPVNVQSVIKGRGRGMLLHEQAAQFTCKWTDAS